MPRIENPINAPNLHHTGDILNPTSTPTLARHSTKGRNVSGRTWKLRPQKRASSLITKNRANARSNTWAVKEKNRLLTLEIKSAQRDMITARIQEKRERNARRLENERRRAENEYKNAKNSMQTLNVKRLGNTMRAMNKKQLRMIKKSRMNSKTGVVEFVGAYER